MRRVITIAVTLVFTTCVHSLTIGQRSPNTPLVGRTNSLGLTTCSTNIDCQNDISPYGTKKACAHCRNAGGPKLGYCSDIIDSPSPAFDWTTKTHEYFCASRTYAEYCGQCPDTGTSNTGSPPMPPQTQPITRPESPPVQPSNPSAPPSEPPSGEQITPQVSPSEQPLNPSAPPSEPQSGEQITPQVSPSEQPLTPSVPPSEQPLNPSAPPSEPQSGEQITPQVSPSEQPLTPSVPPSEPPSRQQITPQVSPSESSPGSPERPTAPSSEQQPVQRPKTLKNSPYENFLPVQGEGNTPYQLYTVPGTAVPSPESAPPTFQLPPAFPDGSVPTTNQGTPQTPETRQPTTNRHTNIFHNPDKSVSLLPDSPSIPEEFQAGYLDLDENYFG